MFQDGSVKSDIFSCCVVGFKLCKTNHISHCIWAKERSHIQTAATNSNNNMGSFMSVYDTSLIHLQGNFGEPDYHTFLPLYISQAKFFFHCVGKLWYALGSRVLRDAFHAILQDTIIWVSSGDTEQNSPNTQNIWLTLYFRAPGLKESIRPHITSVLSLRYAGQCSQCSREFPHPRWKFWKERFC